MTFSKPLLATDTENIKMNWWQYLFGHCWMTGWQSIRSNFRMWSDLMGSNYASYKLLKEDDPEAECLDWFWGSLNEDDVYDKEFLEYLMEMAEDVRTGRVELSPLDDDFFDRLEDLVKDVELDDE
jgi:hypothetical protein